MRRLLVTVLALPLLASLASAQPYAPQQPPQQYPQAPQQYPQAPAPRVAAATPAAQPATTPAQQRNPFQLNAIEQAFLDQVLAKWELESDKVKTFSCQFRRYQYNSLCPHPTIAFTVQDGQLNFQKPDKGSFKINQIQQWQATPVAPDQAPPTGQTSRGGYVILDQKKHGDSAIGDHWVSDGENIYEYRPHDKQLHVTPVPPDMQGEQIVNGPFPFLFGAKADDLKRRYWLRVHENPDPNVIHLVALPKTRLDAGNYKLVEVMLDRRSLLPAAMKVHDHNGSHESFTFDLAKAKVNSRIDRLWNAIFQSPSTPWGWKKVVNDPAARQVAGPQPDPRQPGSFQ